MKQLTYSIKTDLYREIIEVTVFDKDKIFFTIECLIDSPYTIEEEIQNWLDDNGYSDDLFEFNKID